MRKHITLRGREVPIALLVILVVSLAVTVVAALMSFGLIQIGYKITPSGAEAPTLTPSPLSLDFGEIPSGSSGTRDFGKVATLVAPVGYKITFSLDVSSAQHFTTFDVHMIAYEQGETVGSYWWIFHKGLISYAYNVVEAGTYDIQVEVTYSAITVTSETPGTVKIDASYG